MNKVRNLILGILLISCISASDINININAGEPYYLDLGEQYSYYELIGNCSEDDINISQNGTIAIINSSKYIKDCSSEMIFYSENNEIIKSINLINNIINNYNFNLNLTMVLEIFGISFISIMIYLWRKKTKSS